MPCMLSKSNSNTMRAEVEYTLTGNPKNQNLENPLLSFACK
jgi:hypothetical protein